MHWTAIFLGALQNDPFFLILAIATGALLFLQFVLAILNLRKSAGAGPAGWSIALAATTPLVIMFIMVLDVQFSHIAPLHSVAVPPAPDEMLVFLTSAMGEVMVERALCGLALLASAVIGLLGLASTRKTSAPTGKIVVLGVCIAAAAVAAGVLMHTIGLGRGLGGISYADNSERSVLLSRLFEEVPTYTFTLILAFIILFSTTCFGFMKSARRGGTTPAIVAGGLAFLIGAGAFLATRSHKHDVEKLPELLEKLRLRNQILFDHPDVRLLSLINVVDLEPGPVVVVSDKQVAIEGYGAMSTEDVKTSEGETIPDLFERFELIKKNFGILHPGHPMLDKITLQADREVPGVVIRKVLRTCQEAGFTSVQLVTVKPEVLQTSVLGEFRRVRHRSLTFEITDQEDQGLELNDDALGLLARRLDRAAADPPVKVYLNVVLRLSVMQSGKVLLDGNEISLQDLDRHLAEAKKNRGIVFYYREGGRGDPTSAAMEVFEQIIKQGVPIRMSSKPDFSDYIDEKGISHPQ